MRHTSGWRLSYLVALTLLLGVSAAWAQPGPQGQGPQGPRGGPGGPGGPMLERLGLSDAQRDQIKAIVDQQREAGQPGMDRVRSLEQQLNAAVYDDNQDMSKIETLKSQLSQAQAEALTVRVNVEMQIAQVLTPEQRQQLRTMQPRMGPGGPGGPGMRGGRPQGQGQPGF